MGLASFLSSPTVVSLVQLLSFLLVTVRISGSEITENSNDTWAFLNDKVLLQCCITPPNLLLKWMFNGDLLFNGMIVRPVYQAEYSVNETIVSNGHKCSYLVNNQIQLKHSGAYKCKGYNEERTAQLDVLAETPVCNVTHKDNLYFGEENIIVLHCSVEYSGNLDLAFKWKENGHSLPDANNFKEGTEDSSKIILYSLNVTKNESSTFEASLFMGALPEHILKWKYDIQFKNKERPIRDSQISLHLIMPILLSVSILLVMILVIIIVCKKMKRYKKSLFALKIGDTQPPGDGTNDGLIYNSSDKSEKAGAEMPAKSNEMDA